MRVLFLILSLFLPVSAWAQPAPASAWRPTFTTPRAPTWGVPARGAAPAPVFAPAPVPRVLPGVPVAIPPPPATVGPVQPAPYFNPLTGEAVPSIGLPGVPGLGLPPPSSGFARPVQPVTTVDPVAPVTFGPPSTLAPVTPTFGPPTRAADAAAGWLSGETPQPSPAPLRPRPPVQYPGFDEQPLRRQSQIAAERSLWCGPGCSRQRAGQFSRGAWASEADVTPDQEMPANPRTYEATSSRCRVPGCGRVSSAAVGTDGTWRIEMYRPETVVRSAERSWDESVPAPGPTAREAINRANARRLNGK